MNREQAIEHYKEKVSDKLLKEYQEIFRENFINNEQNTKNIIINAMKTIINKAQLNKETYKDYKLSVFQFELLRVNIIDESYKIFIHGYSSLWYLDENSVYEFIELKFLFEPFIELKQKLLEGKKVYLGKVNKYDIQKIIFEVVAKSFNDISEVVREWLWNLDEEQWINNPLVDDFYIVKWSEYQGNSETVFAMNNQEKTINDMLEIKKESKDKEPFIYTVWKNSSLCDAKFDQENMIFINFKGSSLKKINFIKTNMVKAQFKDADIKECKFEEDILICTSFEQAKLTDCNFENSDLRNTDFQNAKIRNTSFKNTNLQDSYFAFAEFKNVSFDEANLEGAVFKAEDIPFLHLTSKQLQTIYIEGDQI